MLRSVVGCSTVDRSNVVVGGGKLVDN